MYAAILNFKMAATTFRPKLFFPISRNRKLIDMILVSIPMLFWVNEPNKTIMITLGH